MGDSFFTKDSDGIKSALDVDLLLLNGFEGTVRIREIARPITNAHSRPQLKT